MTLPGVDGPPPDSSPRRERPEPALSRGKDDDGFAWPEGLDVDHCRLAGRETPAQPKVEEVSPVEVADALEVVLTHQDSLPRDEAEQQLLSSFARTKTSKAANVQIEGPLVVALQRGRVAVKGRAR